MPAFQHLAVTYQNLAVTYQDLAFSYLNRSLNRLFHTHRCAGPSFNCTLKSWLINASPLSSSELESVLQTHHHAI